MMTLWVTRDGQKVAIHGNINLDLELRGSRVQEYIINEDAAHVRSFWGQLGAALEEAEQEAKAANVP
jgi:predicted CoA-binding protein